MTTVKVSTNLHERLRDQARRAGLSQAALIDDLLRGREDADFWAALAAAPAPTVKELDEVDAAFTATARDGDL